MSEMVRRKNKRGAKNPRGGFNSEADRWSSFGSIQSSLRSARSGPGAVYDPDASTASHSVRRPRGTAEHVCFRLSQIF